MELPTSTTIRRPCFIGEDDGLASIAEFSGNNQSNLMNYNTNINNGYFVNHQNQAYMMRRRNSLRNINSLSNSTSSPPSSSSFCCTVVSSPRSSRANDPRFGDFHHISQFLRACSLCNKHLGGDRDIFMYRGDTPFCSEECRQQQIDIDETIEKNLKFKALRNKKDANKSSSSSQKYPVRPGTVAAA